MSRPSAWRRPEAAWPAPIHNGDKRGLFSNQASRGSAPNTAATATGYPSRGRLGVFWRAQSSGKSCSMAFFAEKGRRKLPGNFTFS